MAKRRFFQTTVSLILFTFFLGCSGAGINQVYINQNINFSFIKKVAVLPFENLSQDRFAGKKFRDIFVTTLLSSDSVDVSDFGETMKVYQIYKTISGQPEESEPEGEKYSVTTELVKNLGQALGVQGIILGTVNAFSFAHSNSGSYAEVSVTMRMIDPLTGAIIWSISHTEKGSLVLPSILGVGEETLHETALKAARKIVATLVYQEVKSNKTAN